MPFVGIGLHFAVALFFAVHVVRTGQPMVWMFLLFSFPLLGSAVYFFAVYLPNSRLRQQACSGVGVATRVLDPTRVLREARAAYEFTPTAQNRMRLAAALLDAGEHVEAAPCFEACLDGPFAEDLEIRPGAARAHLEAGNYGAAIAQLHELRRQDSAFRCEEIALSLGRAHAANGAAHAARTEFEAALARFGSFDARAEFAIWAADAGDLPLAQTPADELLASMRRWNRHTRELNAPIVQRQAAYAAAQLSF